MLARTSVHAARTSLRRGNDAQILKFLCPNAEIQLQKCSRRLKSSAAASTASTVNVGEASASAHSKVSTKAADTRKDEEENTLPYLPGPLGLREPPSTERKSWREETLELMNQDVRMARRRHLVKEASRGYYSDLNATRKHGGKTWVAPQTLIREDHALYFPDIMGTSLVSKDTVHTTDLCKGKISVVGMLSTVISEEHISGFVKETNDECLSDPNYRFLQINLQENVAKAFLVSLYRSSLQRSIPKELHSTYLLSKQNLEYVRESLGMNNKHIGFVYLLDEQLRVRWAGGGAATREESTSLRKCVKVLLGRIKNCAS